MSGTFQKPLSGIRLAQTRRGDQLEDIAGRELGDAARWYDLASLNDLIAPWITDDPAQAGPRVHLAGTPIRVPATGRDPSGIAAADDTDLLGTDIELRNGLIVANEHGGIATVSGSANLRQAIRHRIDTGLGELVYHPDYGCGIRELLGSRGDDVANQLAASYVNTAVMRDPRIRAMRDTTAVIEGDEVTVTATALTIDGKRVQAGS